MPERKYTTGSSYRYGFNGKENDKDISAGGQDYGMRIYDGRLGRFLSVDPICHEYPFYSPFQFAGNCPIKFVDIDGKEPGLDELVKQYQGNLSQIAGARTIIKNILEPLISSFKIDISKSSGKAKSEMQSKLAICQAAYADLIVKIYKLQKENENIEVGFDGIRKITKDFNTGMQSLEEVAKWLPFLKRKFDRASEPIKNKTEDIQKRIDDVKSESNTKTENETTTQRGMNNAKTREATDFGNKVHYDSKNGGTGEGLPTELENKYPETQFRFLRRGQKGADVEVVGGKNPWEYEGSNWKPGNKYGDFKPGNKSGDYKFNSEIKNEKLPANTQKLSYDPVTGKLQ